MSVTPIELPPDVLAMTEGMILGVGEEFVWDDGAGGLRDILVRVEDGEAATVRGRWCGTFFGPPPLDDLMGGGVVLPDTRPPTRCTPGSPGAVVADGTPVESAWIDGTPIVALLGEEPSIVLVDLATLESRPLASIDTPDQRPIAASRSESGMWVLTVLAETGGAQRIRYLFVDDQGEPLDLSGNPQPVVPPGDSGLGEAALTPDGSRLLLVDTASDGSVDLIVWDLDAGAPVARFPLLDAAGGRSVASLDVSERTALVNIVVANGETHPHGVILVDLTTGTMREVRGPYGGLEIRHATYLASRRSEEG